MAAAFFLIQPSFALDAPSKTLLLKNGKIWVENGSSEYEFSNWIELRDGLVYRHGKNNSYEKALNREEIDLKGQTVLPAFNDSHVKILEAVSFISKRNPDDLSVVEMKDAVLALCREFSKYGVGSVQGEALIGKAGGKLAKALLELASERRLSTRFSLWGDLEDLDGFLSLKKDFEKKGLEDWVRFDALRAVLDGSLNERSASLLEPYSDAPGKLGELKFTQEKLSALVLRANQAGVSVVLQATGDHAASVALLSFSKVKQQLFNSRVRNRIEHLEVVPRYLYDRFAMTATLASFQPSELISETAKADYYAKRLGTKRMQDFFAMKNFLHAGIRVMFGSAFPQNSVSPFESLFAAIARQNRDGTNSDSSFPAQKLTVEEALRAATIQPAFATKEEHLKGSLREGKFADLVVLESDIFKIKASEILRLQTKSTIVAGKIVFSR